jgi:signal transduction histidine kinase
VTSGDDVGIAVKDDGPGIPREEHRDIFRKFVRGADATRLGIRGTGLGLAIVSHIAAAHRGRVEVESELGKGSTFTIWLPMRAKGSRRTACADSGLRHHSDSGRPVPRSRAEARSGGGGAPPP